MISIETKLLLSTGAVGLGVLIWMAKPAREGEAGWFRMGKRDPFFKLARSRWGIRVVAVLNVVGLLVAIWGLAGCAVKEERWKPGEEDWPHSARTAVYTHRVAANLETPEGVTNLLERRWSLAEIRRFCIPQRRINPHFQNLLVDTKESWKGRLYADRETGFDKIAWYATVRDGRLIEYSLGAKRGDHFWLLEIGDSEAVKRPPMVAPDPSHPSFVGPE